MGQSIQEWTKWNLLKTAFKKFHLVHSWILCPKSTYSDVHFECVLPRENPEFYLFTMYATFYGKLAFLISSFQKSSQMKRTMEWTCDQRTVNVGTTLLNKKTTIRRPHVLLAKIKLTDNRATKFVANIPGPTAAIFVSLQSYLSLEVPEMQITNRRRNQSFETLCEIWCHLYN